MKYADVILPLPLYQLFTYSVPEALDPQVSEGSRVLVPFGRSKSYVGIVARRHDSTPSGYAVKAILELMDSTPILLDSQLRLWQWISEYYMSPLGDVMKAALPAGLKAEEGFRPRTETYIRLTPSFRSEQALHVALNMLARAPKQQETFIGYLTLSGWDMLPEQQNAPAALGEKPWQAAEITREELMNQSGATLPVINQLVKRGLLETYEVEVSRLNREGEYHPEHIKQLSLAQQQAYDSILSSFGQVPVTLLHGVTSSGKTEIYIHLIQREIEQGRQVLYLLPEIALTIQITNRLHHVFGSRLGIYHSKYSDAERAEIWQKQLSSQPYDVILGARSAVFLPFQRLGLVIVDEEHENSYKQQDPAPRYHARSVAIMLASLMPSRPRVLLGTATPCVETIHNVMKGKYGLVELKERYQGIALPDIQVVDIGELSRRKMMTGPFSPLLLARVREALEQGGQAILFQNRRGWSPMVECHQCGWVPHCEHCDVSLTLHRSMNLLTCHYCGFTYSVPTECPCCGNKDLRSRGFGTEKVEDQISHILPMARIARMDLDTTHTRQAYERLISDFSAGRTNLLIGTQMVSKGLDFDRVSVVGILNADNMLNYPDFRAHEHAFTMLAQVSGRAGRKGRRGLVVLQTRQPKLPIISQVVNNDYGAFFRSLLNERQAFNYPPFCRLIYVYLKHQDDSLVDTVSHLLATLLRQTFGTRVLGPDKPAVARVKTLNIRKLVVKLETGINLQKARHHLQQAQQQVQQEKRYASVQIYFDVDPQ